MDIKPQTTKPISDDQELAKVLAGVTQGTNENLDFEESQLPKPTAPTPVSIPVNEAPEPTPPIATDDDLPTIKKEAIVELRPLIEKLDLAPDEKFDIYLLILRSTDDKTLIAPAHIAARSIPDEARRAQALLDIIREIDYLSAPKQ